MIKTYFVSNGLSKILALIICVMVVFNCIISIPAGKMNARSFLDIQKDIFSAVAFVSDVIEGINKSFSDKLIPYSNKNAGQDDSKQGEVVAKMDFIPVLSENQTQNKKNIKSFSAFLLYIAPEDKRFAVDENLNVRFRADRSIVFVFLVLLLSYISFKKPKDEYGIFEKYLI